MANVLFTNVRIIDGSGAQPFAGEVLVEGNRIVRVARGVRAMQMAGTTVVDAGGATLMPGMTEAHTHFSWNDQPGLSAIQRMPTEEHILWCAHIAKRYLDMGWTSCIGAAAAKPRLDVVIRNAIESGQIPGPRYLAASQEITVAGGLADETLPHLPFPEFSFGVVVNGAEDMRRVARMFLKYGVDTLKLNLSGEYIAGIPAEFTPMSDGEIAVAVTEARMRGKRLAAHARSCASVKQCVRHGIDIIFHASFTDEEALDMLEANKDKHFVAPGIAWLINTSYHAAEWGITPEIAKRSRIFRQVSRLHPDGGAGRRDEVRRPDHDAARRARLREGGLFRRSAARRWRSARQHRDPAGSQPAPRGDEEWRLPQGAGDPHGAKPAAGLGRVDAG